MAKNEEAQIQASIVNWIRTVAPQVIVYPINNGLRLSPSQAAKAKWTGTLAGIPDLCVLYPFGNSFYIEVKTKIGRLSKIQEERISHMSEVGFTTVIATSIDDVRSVFHRRHIATKEV